MLNIAYTHASVVSAIFHLFIVCYKISNLIDTHLYSMASVVVLFAYPIKSNISTLSRELHKFYQTSCAIILTDLSNTIKEMLEKISFHKHFKYNSMLRL